MRGDTAGPPPDEPSNGASHGDNGHTTAADSPATRKPAAAAESSASPQPAAAAFTDEPPAVPAKLHGLELGPACAQCGGMMQRTGSCYTCSSCGNNTGCG